MGARDLPDMYARSLRAYISGESRAPMLQVICITSGTLKINLPKLTGFCFAYLYNNGISFDYGIFIWRFYNVCLFKALQ